MPAMQSCMAGLPLRLLVYIFVSSKATQVSAELLNFCCLVYFQVHSKMHQATKIKQLSCQFLSATASPASAFAPAAVGLFSATGSSASTSLTSALVSILTVISTFPWMIQGDFEVIVTMLTHADVSDVKAEEPLPENKPTAAGANAEAGDAEALRKGLCHTCFGQIPRLVIFTL